MPTASALSYKLYAVEELYVVRLPNGKPYLARYLGEEDTLVSTITVTEKEAELFNGLLAIGSLFAYETLEGLLVKAALGVGK